MGGLPRVMGRGGPLVALSFAAQSFAGGSVDKMKPRAGRADHRFIDSLLILVVQEGLNLPVRFRTSELDEIVHPCAQDGLVPNDIRTRPPDGFRVFSPNEGRAQVRAPPASPGSRLAGSALANEPRLKVGYWPYYP
jgi:hypothetical protein